MTTEPSARSATRAVRDDGRMLRLAEALGVSRATLWAVRIEAEARLAMLRARLWPPARREIRALASREGWLVNVACGPFPLDGFVNLDLRRFRPGIVGWDCRRSLPFAGASCAGIRIEHFAEHLDPRDELPRLLRDCRRALMPGGVLRVVVPDTARYLAAYVAGGRAGFDALAVPDPLPDDLPTKLDVVNHVFHQWHEHRWAYDAESLTLRLEQAGLAECRVMAFGQSRLPALAADRDEHAPYSLYVEAIRPPAA